MYPALKNGQILIAKKYSQLVKGDIVIAKNDFDETIEVVFMNNMVTVRSNLRPNQYIIFRKK